MTVYVQGEGCGCVAEVILDGFYFVAVLQGEDGVSVSKIVNAAVGDAYGLCDFLIVVVDVSWVDWSSGF